jgi:ATP/maltotriose-dependent transcriptional regulator MalT
MRILSYAEDCAMPPIIRTKLSPPPVADDTIFRSSLLDTLSAAGRSTARELKLL